MEQPSFIIPEISLDDHLNDKLLTIADLLKTELLRSVQLHDRDIVESTHLTRKRLKLLRAFLKLLKKCGNPDHSNKLNVTFKSWGQSLSELRDIHVYRMFIEDITPEYSKNVDTRVLHKIKEIASSQVDQLENQLVVKDEIFKNLELQISSHSSLKTFINSNTFDTECILEGFKISFRKSHQAFKQAVASELSGPFHEWRKRLKDVQYQLALLRSQQTRINISEPDVERICETLGKDQDLNNFIHWLHSLNLKPKPVNRLIHHLKKSQIELKRQLIIEGQRFYKHSSV
ncbi:CHAD domain-containing protein [Rhodohalobacter sp.]|uniref:CHAD domain-containing protein n=1 Tax=Rhodohalobacter sp. TaxID=1974210 RepID=UPI0035676557